LARLAAMNNYVLTPLAQADIFYIWSYIASDNEDAAERVENAIFDACSFVATNPLSGRRRPNISKRPVLFWTLTRYRNYLVVYRPDTTPVEIIAVLHGKRDLRRMLKQRG
jgi:plasmid stabilization system protein ParE